MANTVKIGITASDEGFKSAFNQMQQSVNNFGKSLNSTSQRSQTVNGALRSLRKEAIELTAQWRAMDDTMRNSDGGRALKQQLQDVLNTAGELQDIKGDVANEIKNIASDTKMWDGAKQGIGVLSSSIQGMASVVGLCGGNVEAFTKALTVMKGVEAATNTIIGIGNALQKDSALMVMLRAARTKLLTTATIQQTEAAAAETTATEAQTVAQLSLNAAVLANPYVLAAAAIVALTVVIVALCSKTDEAAEKEEGLAEATHSVIDATKKGYEEYMKTRMEMDRLIKTVNSFNGTKEEEAQLVKDLNSKYGEALGKYKSLNDWKNSLATTTFYYCRVMQAEAKYAALSAVAYEAYANALAGEDYSKNMAKFERLKEAADKALDDVMFYKDQLKLAQRQAGAVVDTGVSKSSSRSSKTTKGSGKSTSDEEKALEGSLEWKRKELQKRENSLAKGLVPEKDKEKTKQEIEDLKRDIEKDEIELGFKKLKFAPGSLPDLEQQLSERQSALYGGLIPKKDEEKAMQEIEDLKDKILNEKIRLGIEIEPETDYDKYKKQVDKDISTYRHYLNHINEYARDDEEYAKNAVEYEKYQQYLESLEDIEYSTEVASKSTDALRDKMHELARQVDEGKITWDEYNEQLDKFSAENNVLDDIIVTPAVNKLNEPFKFEAAVYKEIPRLYSDAIAEINKVLNENELSRTRRLRLLEEKERLQKEFDRLTKGELSIPAKIEPEFITKGSADDLRKSFSNAQQQVQDIMNDYEIGLIRSSDDAIDKLKEVNEQLKALGLKPIKIELKPEWQNALSTSYEGIQGFTDNIKGIYDAFDSLDDKLKNAKNGFEEFFAVIETGFSVIDSLLSFIETIGKVVDYIKSLTAAKNALTTATANNTTVTQLNTNATESATAAQSAKAAIDSQEAGAALGNAAANTAEAGAKAASQMSSMGPFGWIAGIAAAIAVAGALFGIISQAKGFANGGIIDGSTTMGDNILVRANAGEAILNKRQQARLYKLIDHGQLYANGEPNVSTVKIKGDDMYIQMHNYYKRTKKSPFE